MSFEISVQYILKMSTTNLLPPDKVPRAQRTAKTKSRVDQAMEELMCPLCFSIFSNPLSLQCLHSYCEDCLIAFHRSTGYSDTIACPECRANTLLPPEGIKGE